MGAPSKPVTGDASGPGSRASHEAAPASSPEPSIPIADIDGLAEMMAEACYSDETGCVAPESSAHNCEHDGCLQRLLMRRFVHQRAAVGGNADAPKGNE